MRALRRCKSHPSLAAELGCELAAERLLPPESALLRRLVPIAIVISSFLGCSRARSNGVPPAADPPASGWVVASATDTFRVSIDTAGLAAQEDAPILWVAVTDVSTPERRASTSPFLRFETRQQIDCAGHRARGLDARIPDSMGVLRIHPVGDSTWRDFDSAGLPSPVLRAACDKLRDLLE